MMINRMTANSSIHIITYLISRVELSPAECVKSNLSIHEIDL